MFWFNTVYIHMLFIFLEFVFSVYFHKYIVSFLYFDFLILFSSRLFQVTDSKDLQVPFSTAASLGYGLHHMLHLPPQFLHPLDHRLPFGGFRPLVPSAFAPPSKCLKVETGNGAVPGNGGLPSIGSLSSMSNMFSPTSLPGAGGGAVVSVSGAAAAAAAAVAAAGQEVGGPQSPAGSASRSPTGTAGTGSVPNRGTTPDEEDRDANATPGSENTERSTPEEGRPYRREYPCACFSPFFLSD